MAENPNQNWHVNTSDGHDGHSVRGVLIDREKGIKAVYCPQDKMLVKYVFKRGRGWKEAEAQQYAADHFKQFKSFNHVSVDNLEDFLKVVATKSNDDVSEFAPSSPFFILGEEDGQDIPLSPELESTIERLNKYLKGGSGSGNFSHAGRPGERGGSASEGAGAAGADAARFSGERRGGH